MARKRGARDSNPPPTPVSSDAARTPGSDPEISQMVRGSDEASTPQQHNVTYRKHQSILHKPEDLQDHHDPQDTGTQDSQEQGVKIGYECLDDDDSEALKKDEEYKATSGTRITTSGYWDNWAKEYAEDTQNSRSQDDRKPAARPSHVGEATKIGLLSSANDSKPEDVAFGNVVEAYAMEDELRMFLRPDNLNGPCFTTELINVLEYYGAYKMEDFIRIAGKSYGQLINMCSLDVVEEMSQDFVILRSFGSYMARYLTDKQLQVDLRKFNRKAYVGHFRQNSRQLSIDLKSVIRGQVALEKSEAEDDTKARMTGAADFTSWATPASTREPTLKDPPQGTLPTAPVHTHPKVNHPAFAYGAFHPACVQPIPPGPSVGIPTNGVHDFGPSPSGPVSTTMPTYPTSRSSSSRLQDGHLPPDQHFNALGLTLHQPIHPLHPNTPNHTLPSMYTPQPVPGAVHNRTPPQLPPFNPFTNFTPPTHVLQPTAAMVTPSPSHPPSYNPTHFGGGSSFYGGGYGGGYGGVASPYTRPQYLNTMFWVDTSHNPTPGTLRAQFPDAVNPLYTGIPSAIAREPRRTHVSDKIQWNGRLDSFHGFKKTIEAHMVRNEAGYCVHPTFIQRYLLFGTRALWEFPYLAVGESQLVSDCQFLMGSLQYSCRNGGGGEAILLLHRDSNDGIRAWFDFLQRYDNAGDREVCAEQYRHILETQFTRSYHGGLQQFVTDFQHAFAQLDSLGFYHSDEDKFRILCNRAWNDDTKQLLMFCKLSCPTYHQMAQVLTTYGVKGDHFDLHNSVRQAQHTQTVIPTFNGNAANTGNHYRPRPRTPDRPRTPVEYHIPREAWKLLTPEAQCDYLTKRDAILEQQATTNEPQPTDPKDTPSHPAAAPRPATPSSGIPRQYSAPAERRQANMATHQSDSGSDDDELDMNTLSLVEDFVAHDPLAHIRRANTTLSIRAPSTAMTDITALLARNPPGVFYAISDAGADATIVGDGWFIESYQTHRTANVVGFDEKMARKNGLPIVSAYTVVCLPDGRRVLLRAHEVVYNKGSSFTLLSEFQCRDFGCIVDSVSRKHRISDTVYGTQSFQPPDLDTPIPFELRGCLMAFQHFLPTRHDLQTLTPIDITAATPWDPTEHYESATALPALHTTTESPSSEPTHAALPSSESTKSCYQFCLANETHTPMPLPVDPPFDILFTSSPTDVQPAPSKDPPAASPLRTDASHVTVELPVTVEDIDSDYNDSTFPFEPPIDPPTTTSPAKPTIVDVDCHDRPYHFDPSDDIRVSVGRAFHLTIDFSIFLAESVVDDFLNTLPDDDLFGRSMRRTVHNLTTNAIGGPFASGGFSSHSRTVGPHAPTTGGLVPESVEPMVVTHSPQVEPQRYTRAQLLEFSKYLGYRPPEVVMHTLNNTTQLGTTSFTTFPMRRHFKARYPQLNVHRLQEAVACDTFYSACRDYSGALCVQVFYGCTSKMINVYGMASESQAPDAYKDFIREEGAPTLLRRDNAKVQTGKAFAEINRCFAIKDGLTEPYHPQQNPAEMRAVKWLKAHSQVLMDRNEVPECLWFQAVVYLADLHNHCADESLRWRTPKEIRHGDTPDISAFLNFEFYEPIYYLDSQQSFPNSKERPGRWLGVAHNVGDGVTYRILCEDSNQILNRSVVRSALNKKTVNRRVTFSTPLLEHASEDGDFPDPVPIDPPPSTSKNPTTTPPPPVNTARASPPPQDLPHFASGSTQVPPTTGPTRRKLRLEYSNRPIPINKALNPPPARSRQERKRSKREKRAKKASYLPPRVPVIPAVATTVPTGNEDSDTSNDSDDDDALASDDDEPPDPHLKITLHPPRRTTRPSKPTTFFGCHLHRDRRSSDETTTTPPPDIRLTCALSSITEAIDSTPTMFSTHEHLQPKEPVHASSSPPHKPFGTLFDWDLSDLKPNIARQITYLAQLDNDATDELDQDAHIWRCHRIRNHKVYKAGPRKRVVFVKAEWTNGASSWVQLQAMVTHDPFVLVQYAYDNNLIKGRDWKWVTTMVNDDNNMAQAVRAHQAAVRNAPRFKFGIEVPRNVRHALQLDQANGDTLWRDSMVVELDQINEYQTFRVPDPGEDLSDYQCIPYHFVFDVKYDLRRKARLVAGGNHTSPPTEEIYSGVVGLDAIRMGFLIGDLNDLQCCAADVGNAFLYGKTREKVYIIAGPEFGPLEGQRLIIDRGLYGLRSSAARFHEHFASKLRRMGFTPSFADSDLWIKDCGDHYEFIATYVDDLLVFSRDPMAIIADIKSDYILKGIGEPEYYLGGNVEKFDERGGGVGQITALSARTYITNVVAKFEQMFSPSPSLPYTFRTFATPMAADYHPEVDDSPLLEPRDASKYRALIGSANWMITLGRFDICFAIQAMSRFSMAPRVGHLNAMKRVFGYLKRFPKGRLVVDRSFPDHSLFNTTDYDTWQEFYPDASEDLPPNMPTPKGLPGRITCYVDADHAHDVVTRRSVTGILLFINNTPVKWISKRQNTVETSTYGSELVAARIAVDTIIEFWYKLRMLGVPIEGPAMMLGDNMSVVLNTTLPSSMLKKKHNAIAYHRVREAIAGKITRFAHIPSETNLADILTKPLPSDKFHKLIKPLLFRQISPRPSERGGSTDPYDKRGVAEEHPIADT